MARRQFSVFNLSFLDVISCGFGAVILFFMIINSQVKSRSDQASSELQSETKLLEEQIFDEQKQLVRLNNSLEKTEKENTLIQGSVSELQEKIEELLKEIEFYENNSLASENDIKRLQSDIQQLMESNKRMSAQAALEASNPGTLLRDFIGDGNRQYLTELKLSGKHVLFLVDASASMLGRTYVNVIRYRNMQDSQKVKAPKWRQTVNSVDWLTTRLTEGTNFQIYTFNESTVSAIKDSEGDWLEVTDGTTIAKAMNELRSTIPQNGTSLIKAFEMIDNLEPRPDNIFLLTDGLPTQGRRDSSPGTMVKPEQRIRYFDQAVRELPPIPVNVLLFPMDGDPFAAEAYWRLAIRSKGSFMAPSRDWP